MTTISAPVDVGLCRDDAHRYYWNGIGPLTSITTALKAVDKSGPFAASARLLTAQAAVRNLDVLPRLIAEGGEQAAVDFLKKHGEFKWKKAADVGTSVHAVAEAIARGQDVPVSDEDRPFVNAFLQWQHDWQPRFTAAEYMVAHLGYGYAGTGDGVVLVDGRMAREHFACLHDRCRIRFDTKTKDITGKDPRYIGPYSETGLQLAAAHFAEFSGRPGDPKQYAVPRADHHAVLHLRSDGSYAFVPYAVDEGTFAAFLNALALWGWMQGPAKSIVGQINERKAAA